MQVVGFVGSPRKEGNAATLVREALKGAREGGADTQLYLLNELDIKGCQSCRACKQLDGACVQKDGMTPLYEAIKAASGIVIGTPVFFWQMTAQTKLFMDRLYPFLNLDFTHKLGPGKRTVMIYTQGAPSPDTFQASFAANQGALGLVGLKIEATLVATGVRHPGDVLKNREVMTRVYGAGRALAAGQQGPF